MPIYEYKCRKCGSRFEKIVIGTRAEVVCPKCGGREVEQVVSGFAVRGGRASSAGCAPGRPT
ncbi:MAG: zinc ribbon domain-containing protein [Acidobacteriota bacterium]